MHQDNTVRIFAGETVGNGSPAGVGWLVEPAVVLMRQPGRGATPGLPLHIVPAGPGGGRDGAAVPDQAAEVDGGGARGPETSPIPVLGVHGSDHLPGWVALVLDQECVVPAPGVLPDGLDLPGTTVSEGAADPEAPGSARSGPSGAPSLSDNDGSYGTTSSWLCRCFPSLPGCR